MSAEFSDVQFLKRLNSADKKVRASATKHMGLAGRRLLRDALMEPKTVPLKEGTLRGAGAVHVNNQMVATAEELGYPQTASGKEDGAPADSIGLPIGKDSITATVGFNTAYAARSHEHQEFNFTEPGSGGKYLERPLLENAERYPKIVATGIRKDVFG